ncbi:sigma 54-interacting transcriptional regulator [Guyparkeria hydrothermalis]|uniref:sigma 54-interacting transcriptional regulator n=1 Tax=Guyparkeria TaxID=2035712 RepID=UPI0010ACE884|nr:MULTISPECIES: sigma 54-interacting transcriptional regulator [Guyparkeria]MCL7751403.1 sigma 54-interacting transcriptional regulator [Guyparkeria hydrothermalis]TKA91871.1 GAF domain-containing protein [Guyparkeria sp. SB14A]
MSDAQALQSSARADSADAELLVVHEATQWLSHLNDPDTVIGRMLRLLSQITGLNRGRVVLPDASGEFMEIRYAYGLSSDERDRGRYRVGEGVTGRVMRTGQVAVVQDIDEEPVYLTRAVERDTLPPETVAFLAVPILNEDQPMGVLGAHRIRERHRPLHRDITLLRIMAALIARVLKVDDLIREQTAALAEENESLREALSSNQEARHGILGESPALRQAFRQTLHVSPTQATVLLNGESGTGKERFARMVHLTSPRCDGPFIAINCAAIPDALLESELFGHEKGAFTGAVSAKKGSVELASGGTLFLDEIGDLAFDLQSKLLHVLEKQTIHRVGGTKDVPVDVRIIAATHKNLQEAVNQGRFRIDLFYRLNVFPIHLPALRERDGDVKLLARHFLQVASQEFDRNATFEAGVLDRLAAYNWPGNIRQLENVIKRAVLVAQNGWITVADIELILTHESHVTDHLEAGGRPEPSASTPGPGDPAGMGAGNTGPDHAPSSSPGSSPGSPHGQPPGRAYRWVREDEADALLAALEATGGNKTQAASRLGMTTRQFRYRLDKLGLQGG